MRSGTSVAAHYREAVRAKSDLDFISKLEGVQQELDESDLWLELLADSGVHFGALYFGSRTCLRIALKIFRIPIWLPVLLIKSGMTPPLSV